MTLLLVVDWSNRSKRTARKILQTRILVSWRFISAHKADCAPLVLRRWKGFMLGCIPPPKLISTNRETGSGRGRARGRLSEVSWAGCVGSKPERELMMRPLVSASSPADALVRRRYKAWDGGAGCTGPGGALPGGRGRLTTPSGLTQGPTKLVGSTAALRRTFPTSP